MDAKRALTKGVWCPIPWTGLMFNHDGTVKNCIRSAKLLGNINNEDLDTLLHTGTNLDTQIEMLHDRPGKNCFPCYDLERNKRRFDIISDRVFYIRELKNIPFDRYQPGHHDLKMIDVRWSNLCNFACVYCSSDFSSRWEQELGENTQAVSEESKAKFKQYIFDRASQLQHVYLAGGEPLLIKENLELLDVLLQVNPLVNVRINTNLSKVDTAIFDRICQFRNVHWTVSVESMCDQFEYIRYGGNWQDFLTNLHVINQTSHKITFNMLWFVLNHRSIFDCIDFLLAQGFHANSFVAGPLLEPRPFNIKNLSAYELDALRIILDDRISGNSGYLLEDSYRNMRHYLDVPFESDPAASIYQIRMLDHRRGLDSHIIFPEFYRAIDSLTPSNSRLKSQMICSTISATNTI